MSKKQKKNFNKNITLEVLDKIPHIIFEMSTALGLEDSSTSHKHFYIALKNSKVVEKSDPERPLWNKLDNLGFVEQYNLNTFRLTYRGLNFLQGCLLKFIKMQNIPLGKVSEDKAR